MTGWLVASVLAALLAWTVLGYWSPRRRWRLLFAPAPAEHATKGARWAPLLRAARNHARPVALASVGAAALAGAALGGPVAAVVLAAYSAAGIRFAAGRARALREVASARAAVDAVAALAAQLRAGAAVDRAVESVTANLSAPRLAGEVAAIVARRLAASVEVAQSSGAPLADLLDRLDHHLRAVDRARAGASAQAAGAAASATLLAVMPVAGAAMGFLIGIDPLQILLHTPLGSACLLASVALQLAGLAWAIRLAKVVVPA